MEKVKPNSSVDMNENVVEKWRRIKIINEKILLGVGDRVLVGTRTLPVNSVNVTSP